MKYIQQSIQDSTQHAFTCWSPVSISADLFGPGRDPATCLQPGSVVLRGWKDAAALVAGNVPTGLMKGIPVEDIVTGLPSYDTVVSEVMSLVMADDQFIDGTLVTTEDMQYISKAFQDNTGQDYTCWVLTSIYVDLYQAGKDPVTFPQRGVVTLKGWKDWAALASGATPTQDQALFKQVIIEDISDETNGLACYDTLVTDVVTIVLSNDDFVGGTLLDTNDL